MTHLHRSADREMWLLSSDHSAYAKRRGVATSAGEHPALQVEQWQGRAVPPMDGCRGRVWRAPGRHVLPTTPRQGEAHRRMAVRRSRGAPDRGHSCGLTQVGAMKAHRFAVVVMAIVGARGPHSRNYGW